MKQNNTIELGNYNNDLQVTGPVRAFFCVTECVIADVALIDTEIPLYTFADLCLKKCVVAGADWTLL